ncbi:gastrula zinc finger protein XlCGF58.1-like isoform X1 [Cydia pomonella]|uniref:gastrula zinc finger protein XlCGF58.1-like isoform X1 n=1 Tax=Cydia pomonella TaxID=82600 RepID=UPI002ADE412E|nr:gastrula zinc finger protein XlCGF58.1-like isoform X1 [Cydia pomonella]
MQYFVKMYAVKRETEEVLCHGCLSANRSLSPLTNYEMYFCLLGNKQTLEEYKYLNILLCWECQALLRRTQRFRNTLQRAQYLLSVAHTEQVSLKSLSTLTHTHKEEYDCSIEESIAIESKNEVELFIDNSDTHIKEEIEDNLEIDNIDTYSDNIKDENELKIIKTTKKYKKDTEKREFKKLDNGLDMRNPEKYFSEICLSEKEVGEILEREREEDASRPHKCDVCGFWFVSRTDVYDHKKTMHRQRSKPGKCPQCAFPYKSLWDLELHSWRSHPVNRCSLCGRVVASRDKGKHLQMHRFRYRCLKCGADFDNKHWYHHHEKQLHSKYICAHCDRTVNTKKSLEKHVIRHHLPATCSCCGARFPTWERLRRHARDAHERTGPAYCVECDRSFLTPAKYRRHLSQSQRHRPQKKVSVPCPECGKVFSRKNYMNNHMKLFHSNQSRHHCPLCDKYFVNGWGLRTHHKFVHEKIPLPKTKICSVCGRGFGTNRVLENHMRTHTGERPFSCARCPAAFAQRVALKAHLAAIHKEK